MNPNREIRIEKVTLNIGCGEAGEKLDKAKRLLEKLTEKKVVITKARERTTFGASKGKALGCKVTLRGKNAEEFLRKALEAIDFKISERVFDRQGNFSFGVKEHIHIPGVENEPEIGIFGMDVCVTRERRGYRVKRRGLIISQSHRIKPDEAKNWAAERFKIKVD